MQVLRLPVLHDNYVWLAHAQGPEGGVTAVIDPALPGPVLEACERQGWHLDFILNTHHHMDHVGGNLALKEATGCTIVGPAADRSRIPGIDVEVHAGDIVRLGDATARVLFVPGHTRGHIAYFFDEGSLFCGDSLFLGGCGRLFEGTPAQMFESLAQLASLPDDTRIYCAHEYTESNLRFALSERPDDPAIQDRYRRVCEARQRGEPTVPGLLAEERSTNLFVMARNAEELGAIRSRKDNF